jgi:hypothetical protein
MYHGVAHSSGLGFAANVLLAFVAFHVAHTVEECEIISSSF